MKRSMKMVILLTAILVLLCAAQTAFANSYPPAVPQTPFYIKLAEDDVIDAKHCTAQGLPDGFKRMMQRNMIIRVTNASVTPWICEYSDPGLGYFSFYLPDDMKFLMPDDQAKCAEAFNNQSWYTFNTNGSWVNDANYSSLKNDRRFIYDFTGMSAITFNDQSTTTSVTHPIFNFVKAPGYLVANEFELQSITLSVSALPSIKDDDPAFTPEERAHNIWLPVSKDMDNEIREAYGNDLSQEAIIQFDGNGNYRIYYKGEYHSLIWPL